MTILFWSWGSPDHADPWMNFVNAGIDPASFPEADECGGHAWHGGGGRLHFGLPASIHIDAYMFGGGRASAALITRGVIACDQLKDSPEQGAVCEDLEVGRDRSQGGCFRFRSDEIFSGITPDRQNSRAGDTGCDSMPAEEACGREMLVPIEVPWDTNGGRDYVSLTAGMC